MKSDELKCLPQGHKKDHHVAADGWILVNVTQDLLEPATFLMQNTGGCFHRRAEEFSRC